MYENQTTTIAPLHNEYARSYPGKESAAEINDKEYEVKKAAAADEKKAEIKNKVDVKKPEDKRSSQLKMPEDATEDDEVEDTKGEDDEGPRHRGFFAGMMAALPCSFFLKWRGARKKPMRIMYMIMIL